MADGNPDPSGPDRRTGRTGFLFGFLVAIVLALGVIVAILLTHDSKKGGRSSATTSVPTATTGTAPVTSPATVTVPPPTTTTTTTTTAPTAATISQVQAEGAAAAAASREAARGGISIAPRDFDAHCTATGGASQASTWSCDVASSSGQCSGPVTVYAVRAGVAATRNPQISCGE